jgi:hypothetical protein
MISNIFANSNYAQEQVTEDMIRHMALNSLRSYRTRFFSEFGELVICCDSTNIWRKDVSPYYKSNRKTDRAASSLDWDMVFKTIGNIKQELIETFPYKVMQVDCCEADDIIAVLTQSYQSKEPILILSGDKDFKQLHNKTFKVRQYAPIQKEFVTCDDPQAFLQEQIIRGDRGDGIPNILSPEDCIVNGVRQTPITKKFLESFDLAKLDPKVKARYKTNRILIDLQSIPGTLVNRITSEYELPLPEKSDLYKYFLEHKLVKLMPQIGEF